MIAADAATRKTSVPSSLSQTEQPLRERFYLVADVLPLALDSPRPLVQLRILQNRENQPKTGVNPSICLSCLAQADLDGSPPIQYSPPLSKWSLLALV